MAISTVEEAKQKLADAQALTAFREYDQTPDPAEDRLKELQTTDPQIREKLTRGDKLANSYDPSNEDEPTTETSWRIAESISIYMGYPHAHRAIWLI